MVSFLTLQTSPFTWNIEFAFAVVEASIHYSSGLGEVKVSGDVCTTIIQSKGGILILDTAFSIATLDVKFSIA